MAKMIPPVMADYKYDGERDIGIKLQEDPATEDWLVLHSLDIVSHKSQIAGECDFVIIIPGKGVLCVEVKACKSLKVDNGTWYYGVNPKGDKRGPFKQASSNMRSIQNHLFKVRPDLKNTVFWSAVIFPFIPFQKSSPEWHDWQVIDANEYLSKPVSQLFLNVLIRARQLLSKTPTAKWFNSESELPNKEQCNSIAAILRPEFEFFESPAARQKKLVSALRHYTEEQYIALDAMQFVKRAVFDGPAGTGKTLLVIEAGRRELLEKRKTLILSYNKNIAEWIASQFSEEHKDHLTVSTLHAFMLRIVGKKTPQGSDSEFWNRILPEMAIEKLLVDDEAIKQNLYDTVIIDEAQDILRPDYLDFLDLCIKSSLAKGRWRMFGDFTYQRIYSAANIYLEDFINEWSRNTPIYPLVINCRNTPRVAAYAPLLGGLKPDYKKILRADDYHKPELIFYENDTHQVSLLVEQLTRFRDGENYKGNDIIILSPLSQKCCAMKLAPPWKDRIQPYQLKSSGGHVQYSTIHSFKGLESPVVLVTDLTQLSDKESRNLFYIAITRSLSRLVLILHESVRKDLKSILGV